MTVTKDKNAGTDKERTERSHDFDQAPVVELIAILAIFCTTSSFFLVLATILCVWRRRIGRAKKNWTASPPLESKEKELSKEVDVEAK